VKRRILVIAPTLREHEELPNKFHEISEIRRYHNATVIEGDVDLLDLSRAVNENNYNVIWIISGATGDKIHLSTSTIGYDELRRIISASGARLLMLSSCDTKILPNRLRAANIHILAGINILEDRVAASVGMQFARELRRQSSIRKAYYALNANENWLYLSPNGGLEDAKYYFFAFGLGLGIAFIVGMIAAGTV